MADVAEAERVARPNQRRRTRQDLLRAAARLVRQGRRPSLEKVAEEEALVSRATAYRYFPSPDALLLEASFDVAIPEPGELFRDGPAGDDPAARLERVDAALHDVTVANEVALRMTISQSVLRALDGGSGDGAAPVRQNRRTPLIEAALEPARDGFQPSALDLLGKAVALLVGPEAVVVAQDVLRLDDAARRGG